MDASILLIFLGSILTFLGTVMVEERKESKNDSKQQRRYGMYASLQLGAIRKVLDKMRHSYENGGTYEQVQRDTGLLVEATKPLNNFRNDTTMLDDTDKQGKLIDLIADLNLYASDVSSLIAAEADLKTPISAGTNSGLMTTKHIELIELCRRTDELMDSLGKMRNN